MFESAKLKLERANHHIADLRATFDTFIGSNTHRLVFGYDPYDKQFTLEISLSNPIPQSLSLIIGDAIHTLRTVLDHATWELIGVDGGAQNRHLQFPTGARKRDYEATCNGIKTPRSDTKDFFVRLAAYEGGAGAELYALHLLNNADKHTVTTPIVGAPHMKLLKLVNSDGTGGIEIGDCTFEMSPDGRTRLVGWGIGLGLQLDSKSEATIEIFFRDIEAFRFKPIIPTLMHLSDVITDTLRQFETFVQLRAPQI